MNEQKFKKWLLERKEDVKEFYEKNKFWFGWFGAAAMMMVCKRVDEEIHNKMYPDSGIGFAYDEDDELPFKVRTYDHNKMGTKTNICEIAYSGEALDEVISILSEIKAERDRLED